MLRRVVAGIAGVLLILLAGAAGATAAWGYRTFADAGSLRMDLGTVVPGAQDTAIVLDVARFGATVPYLDAIGRTRLAVSSAQPDATDDTMFVATATTAAADAFVHGTSYAVALRDADGWQVRRIPGTQPLPPTDTGTWLTQGAGWDALVEVPTTRPLTVVVTRPDAGPVGAVNLAADFSAPTTWTTWLAIVAAVLGLGGVVLLVYSLRRRRVGAHEATAVPEPVEPEPEPTEVEPEPTEPEPVEVDPVEVEPVEPEPVDPEATAELPVICDPHDADPHDADPHDADPHDADGDDEHSAT